MNRLNNHGQTLIMFVILLPLLLIIMAFIIDTSYIYCEKIKLESNTKEIIKNLYDYRLDSSITNRVNELYKKNNIDNYNVKLDVSEKYLKIINDYEIDSLFGNIIGIKKYKIKTNIKGYMKDSKIKYEKE